MRALPLMLLAAACAADGTQSAGTQRETRDQRELARELADRTAGDPQRCIPARQNEALSIVDSRTVVLRSGPTVWVNRLDGDCPGLRPMNTLLIEAHGSQYCRGDRVRGIEPGSTIPGAICVLRNFTPYRRPR